MRINPAVPMAVPHRAVKDTTLNGYKIPEVLSKFFFYLPTDAQLNCLKSSFKIYIKIDIKTAPTCFG
jgi:hypothetical protein